MRVETALAAGIVAVVVGSLLAVAVVPGALAGSGPERGTVRLNDVTLASGEVAADAATLEVTAHLANHGGRSENLSVRVRAVRLESGMLETTVEQAVDPIEGDREVAVPIAVTVPREGGYRIEVLLYRDGRRIDDASREVRGVGSLQPPAAASPVEFHRFDRRPGNNTLPSVQYSVVSAGGGEARLNVSAYLTNARGGDTGDLRVEFVFRQVESNIVAARTRVPVGEIAPGHTETPHATVTVPDGYNYYIDAILWKDGVIVGSARSAANLDPTRTISVNRTTGSIGLQVSDFEQRRGRGDAAGTPTPQAAEATSPGLGLVAGVLALLGAALLWTRVTNHDS